MHVDPSESLVDEPLIIQLRGLKPGGRVTLRSVTGEAPYRWVADADFEVREDGTVDPSVQAPLSGSYAEVDAMGLLWSMAPEGQPPPVSNAPSVEPFEISFSTDTTW